MAHEPKDSTIVYQGRFINVRLDRVDIGTVIVEREVIEETSEGVLVVPVTTDGKIVLVEQRRHLLGTTFEVPSGAINLGETPHEAAARELREEAGLEAGHLELISTHVNSVHMKGRNYYFIATDLSTCAALVDRDPDEEFISVKPFSSFEIDQLIEENKIPDIRNRGCIWLTQLRMFQGSLIKPDSKARL